MNIAKTNTLYAPRLCNLLEVYELTPQEKLFRLQLADGGVLAAPLAAYVCKKIPVTWLMLLVGLLILLLSLRAIAHLILGHEQRDFLAPSAG